ncbi:MAG: hypothetical protein GX117_01100 [Candidatus Hydrogenedentes bacterium]|nr:hypothetical protein [Candidatus Hydrogenedentota bacterium]
MTKKFQTNEEPIRLCPTCRMSISALATRCRYCGEEVSRPRKEQPTYTVSDLGGESQGTYTVSSSVTDALESFMMEERVQVATEEQERIEAEQRSLSGRLRRLVGKPVKEPDPTNVDLRMGKMDIDSISLSSPATRSSTSVRRPRRSVWSHPALWIVLVPIFLIMMYFLADALWTGLHGNQNGAYVLTDSRFSNRALEQLIEDGDYVAAHETALLALKASDTAENRSIADEVRKRCIDEIKAKAYAVPFDMEQLRIASREISQIGHKDRDPEIRQLMDAVNREVGYFYFILQKIDLTNASATFRLNNPSTTEKEEEVQEGDLFQQRFLVTRILSDSVALRDTASERAGTELISRRMEAVTAY